jgi:hypothetical protein
MIIDEVVNTNTNNRNYKKFRNLGYKFNIGDVISVNYRELNFGSISLVKVECDFCGRIKESKYNMYIKNISNQNLYACSGKCAINKFKKTNLERYGVEFPTQNDKIKEKTKDYFISKYGVDHPSMLEEFELKKQNTNLERYGVKHQMYINDNISKIKETKLGKYGDGNYNNFEKHKETCLLKYGVDNVMKVPEFFIKNIKSSFSTKFNESIGLYYQGTYELDFIEFCVDKNIKIKKGIVIDYVMNNKNRKYYSDFFIEECNLICEIKSSYTYNVDYEENLLKMKGSIDSGYNFLFIIDKDYSELEKIIKNT